MRLLPWAPLLATALVLHDCYVPGQSPVSLLGVMIWLAVIGYLIVRASKPPAHFKKTVGMTAVLLAVSGAAFTGMPEKFALKLSRNQLEKFAKKAIEDKSTYTRKWGTRTDVKRAHVGAFSFIDYAVEPDGGVYMVTTIDWPDAKEVHGLAFGPNAEDRCENNIFHRYKHIDGIWYDFIEVEGSRPAR